MFTDQRNPGVAIGILLTGGSLTLASVLKEAFVAPARAVAGGAKLAARAGRKLSKNVFEFLLKFLRDEIPKFIRKLNEPQKLIDEIVEGVKEFLSASGKAGLKSERELLNLIDIRYRASLKRDLKANPELRRWFSDRPELLDAWKELDDAGVDAALKKDPSWLNRVSSWTDEGLDVTSEGRILKEGNEVGRIVGDRLHVKYTGHGGNIVCDPDKTTTLLGKWEEPTGSGTSNIIDSKLSKSGQNKGGANVLSEDIPDGWTDQQI